jgi:Rrf2 family transcriptional regulator, cysteine metabolism repressor
MKLSTRGRYGTRSLLKMSLHYGEVPLLLKDISKRQQNPLQYIEHSVNSLVAAGLVKSVRGVKGGVWLAKLPSEIKLSEAIGVLEGGSQSGRVYLSTWLFLAKYKSRLLYK